MYILQGSVATQLSYGGIFNNNLCKFSAEYPSEKKIENRLIFEEHIDKRFVARFYGPRCRCVIHV